MSDLEAQVCAILNVMVSETVSEMSKIIGGSEPVRTEVTPPPCGTENTEESPEDKVMQFSSFVAVLAQEVVVKICQLFNESSSALRLEGAVEMEDLQGRLTLVETGVQEEVEVLMVERSVLTSGEGEEPQSDEPSERKGCRGGIQVVFQEAAEMEDLQGRLTGVETGVQEEVEVLTEERIVLTNGEEEEPQSNEPSEMKSCSAVVSVDCEVKPSPVINLWGSSLYQDSTQLILINDEGLKIIQASTGSYQLQDEHNPDDADDDDADDDDNIDDDDDDNCKEEPEGPTDADPAHTTRSTHLQVTKCVGAKARCLVKEKTLSCQHCTKMFSTMKQLKTHQAVHEAKIFVCSQCGKTFSIQRSLKDHMLLHTGERPHICDVCGKTFTRKQLLTNHQRIHNNVRKFQCEQCGKTFHLSQDLKRHQRIHTGERRYTCSFCNKGFSLVGNLRRHMRIHTGEKPYTCEVCGKSFNQRDTLKGHQRRHTGERPFSCETCGLSFIQSSSLKLHQQVSHSEQKLTCVVCGTVTTCTIPKPQAHGKTIPCVSCGHQLTPITKLLKDRPYSCSTCGKSFMSPSYLKTHLRVHSGEKPFSCETCGRMFSHQISLKSHQVTHTGEKPFSCRTCGKRFSHYANMCRHQLIHTGEKPYICETCGRSFNQSNSLKAHQQTHSDNKPHMCDLCGKSFAYPRSLREHKCAYA